MHGYYATVGKCSENVICRFEVETLTCAPSHWICLDSSRTFPENFAHVPLLFSATKIEGGVSWSSFYVFYMCKMPEKS